MESLTLEQLAQVRQNLENLSVPKESYVTVVINHQLKLGILKQIQATLAFPEVLDRFNSAEPDKTDGMDRRELHINHSLHVSRIKGIKSLAPIGNLPVDMLCISILDQDGHLSEVIKTSLDGANYTPTTFERYIRDQDGKVTRYGHIMFGGELFNTMKYFDFKEGVMQEGKGFQFYGEKYDFNRRVDLIKKASQEFDLWASVMYSSSKSDWAEDVNSDARNLSDQAWIYCCEYVGDNPTVDNHYTPSTRLTFPDTLRSDRGEKQVVGYDVNGIEVWEYMHFGPDRSIKLTRKSQEVILFDTPMAKAEFPHHVDIRREKEDILKKIMQH